MNPSKTNITLIATATLILCLHALPAVQAAAANGAKFVQVFNYTDCIELSNATTRVVLCPYGGRVLEYSLDGTNALYVDEQEAQWTPSSGRPAPTSAGRFDIGPEKKIPQRPNLWTGRWSGQIIGPRAGRLTSVKDDATGTQLTRVFHLDDNSSQLTCEQTITNISDATVQWCHWSRTFALGNGICLIPLSANSRFPNNYVMYEPGDLINFRPQDPHIRARDGYLEIDGVPRYPKLGMDSYEGWFAYLMRNDLMFVKRFPTFPNRVYNEVAGLTISIWYPEDRRVELEPIGPRERLEPGQSASFTEVWSLLPFKFPASGQSVDLDALARVVRSSSDK